MTRRERPVRAGCSPKRSAPRRAFSIIELIVVMVILAVLAAATLPRLISMTGRQGRADAEAVAELLSIAGRRDDATSQRVALDYDRDRSTIRLLTRRGDRGDWLPDLFSPPVELNGSRVESVQSDGVELDAAHWRIEFPQVTRRPTVTIVLADDSGKGSWRISLASGSTRATMGAATAGVAADGSVDLDAAGREEDPW